MKILVCHDGSPLAQSALEKTIAMFKATMPEMIIVTVAEESANASSYSEEAFEEWREKREADLKLVSDSAAAHGLSVDAILAIGEPRRMLMEAIAKKLPDLVVITSRARTETGIRFGSVTVSVSSYLLRHIKDCPVLVMH
jgi:nucleotide-binding universal stress UspA family protein